jgi:hypothetical protein
MQDWRAALADLAGVAPPWMRALASDELHIGGFTNVQLAHPVIDLRSLADEERVLRAAAWFCGAAIAAGASVARFHCGATAGRAVAAHVRRRFGGALSRVDDESVALLRYFDVYLKPSEQISDAAGSRALAATRHALADVAQG